MMRVEDAVSMGDTIAHSESVLSPIKDADGTIFAVAVVYRDITKRKLAERERESLINELQDAMAKVNTLTGLLPICAPSSTVL